MKRLNKIAKKIIASDELTNAYKQMLVDYIQDEFHNFPSLDKTYLEDLCWDTECQKIANNVKPDSSDYLTAEHSMYYDKIKDYVEIDGVETQLIGNVHVDFSMEYHRDADGDLTIFVDVYPELKTKENDTYVLADGFSGYCGVGEFDKLANALHKEIDSINVDWIDVY